MDWTRAWDGVLVSLVTASAWALLRLFFGRKAVATWRWNCRGFYRAYWFVLYYLALIVGGVCIAYHEWLAAAIWLGGYWLMSRDEKAVRDGSYFRRAYVEEARDR